MPGKAYATGKPVKVKSGTPNALFLSRREKRISEKKRNHGGRFASRGRPKKVKLGKFTKGAMTRK